ncbi:NAD(P)/FAD-dependent oxidoreductase [Nocardioides sp. GXQ0305]|uniref:NAD(P)/FAD-dependent oxidoreductase n=1 Tax=Nocardioides sp. GXQ0305 TaxID=3423912 RepID=UPI003D7E4720
MEDFDVVVVGARVAGASTALLLARAGVRVALVDRGRYGSDTVSTHGLMRAGVLQLHRWGLLDDVVAHGTPAIRRTKFLYAHGETTVVDIRPSPGVPALYAPRRFLLDRLLVDAAAEAGAVVLHEHAVTSVVHEGRRVAGVRAQDPQGRTVELRGAVTVGADGIRSLVAADTGARIHHRGEAAGAVLYRYVHGLGSDGYEWAYGAGAAAGLIPTNDGLSCVFVGTSPARMRALRSRGSEHAFRCLLGQSFAGLPERVAAAEPVGRLHGWAGVPGHLRQCWGPGWALVGDAGYFKDPITSHGITDALRDAELLSDALLESLGGGVAEREALAAYQATRDRVSTRLFAATEAVAAYDWGSHDAGRLVREVSAAMGDEVELLQDRPLRTADVRLGSRPVGVLGHRR